MTDSKLVDIACFVRTETARAWRINDGHREVWIPKSQCEVEVIGTASAIATMPEWLAKEKELI
jgi:RNase P/RNase MRP subunit p29